MAQHIQISHYTIIDYSNDEYEQLESIWRNLECGAEMTAFQSYDWYYNLHTLYPYEKTKNLLRVWRYILVMEDSVPVLIAPLEIQRIGIGYKNYGSAHGVYFIGRSGYTDYLNFIYKDFTPEALVYLLSYIKKKYHQNRFHFDRMLEQTSSYGYISQKFSISSIPIACAALTFYGSFEEYRLSLSKSTRQNIRTAINRANRDGISLEHTLIFDEQEKIKDEIRELNEQRLMKKRQTEKDKMSLPGKIYCFFSSWNRKLFSASLDVLAVTKNTFAFLVKDGEKLVSFFWGIRNDYLHELYVILVGVAEDYEWYSPNISHLYLFIEEQYQKTPSYSIRIMDFTRGAEGYKKTIGCTERKTSTVIFKVSDND